MATKTKASFTHSLILSSQNLNYFKERKRLWQMLWDSELYGLLKTEDISEIFRQYWAENPKLAVCNTYQDIILYFKRDNMDCCFPQDHLLVN